MELVEEVVVAVSCLEGRPAIRCSRVANDHGSVTPERGSTAAEGAQLPGGAVVVEVADEDGVLGGMDGIMRGDAVLTSRLVDPHAT